MRRSPDRALRRMLADLARLHPDDVEAILGALEPAERKQVDRLIAGLDGGPAGRAAPSDRPAWSYEGVSPWLLERIEPGGKGGAFVLTTPASAAALKAAAEPFRVAHEPPNARGPTLLDLAIFYVGGARR